MDCTSRPQVSVIVNCLNGERFLSQCIQSVRDQSVKNWEVVFWDNNSTDRSVEIVQEFRDSRIKVFSATETTPLYAARNLAIKKARGPIICFLDVDDFWDRTKLELQIPFFANPNVGLVYSDYWFLDEVRGACTLGLNGRTRSGAVLDWVLERDSIVISGAMILREALSEDEPCDPRLHVIGDFDLWVRVAANYEVVGVNAPLVTYRWHGNNDTIKRKKTHLEELHRWLVEKKDVASIGSRRGFKVRAESVACRRLFADLEDQFSFSRFIKTLDDDYIERKSVLVVKMLYRTVFWLWRRGIARFSFLRESSG